MKKWIKRILITVFTIFIIASIVPYLISIDLYRSNDEKPFKESKYTEIEDIKIHYRSWTPETEEIKGKILMVHGLAGSTFSWRNNVQELKDEGYIVVAVDLPGFGYSDKKAGMDHSQENRSKILWSLLEDMDLTLSEELKDLDWTLVGHSMGGGTVSAMTMDNPDEVNELVLVSGAVFDNSPPLVSNILYYPPIKRGIDVAFSNYIINQERVEALLESEYGRKPSKDEVEGYLEPLRIREVPSFIPDLIRTAKNEPVERLNDSEVPILYIAGANDTWVPEGDPEKLKGIVPRVNIETIENSAHGSMETSPDEFNELLISFIKNQ